MEIYELLPTPNTMDAMEPKTAKAVLKEQTVTRKGRKKFANLKEVIPYGLYLTSSPADSPASLFPKQDEGRVRQMIATSGRRCFESYENFIRGGSSVKMLAASLLGATVWYSNKSTLTWKVKVTASKRLLFQLYPSTLRTAEIESGLLPEMLGTPSASDWKGNHGGGQGKSLRTDINQASKLLPTPNASEAMKGRDNPRPAELSRHTPSLGVQTGMRTGLKLQPAFVEWMMGYPDGWTAIPDSKVLAMRLSRKSRPKS